MALTGPSYGGDRYLLSSGPQLGAFVLGVSPRLNRVSYFTQSFRPYC